MTLFLKLINSQLENKFLKFSWINYVSRRNYNKQNALAKESSNQTTEFLELALDDGRQFKFNVQWLRDSCKCPRCTYFPSGLRLNDEFHEAVVKNSHLSADGLLNITWHDDHSTSLPLTSLFSQNASKVFETEKKLWDGKKAENIPFFHSDFKKMLESEEEVGRFLTSVYKYGMAVVTKVPPTSEDTKTVMERLGPIRGTFWGKVYHVVADLDQFAHPSYTGNAVQLHTDTNYYFEGSGLQAFHVLKHVGTGAINCFVDGFHVADVLKRQHPAAYEFLSTTPVSFKYDEERLRLHLMNEDFILKHDKITDQIEQIRYTPYDLDVFRTVPQKHVNQLYSALKIFKEEVNKKENKYWYHLRPGSLLVTDNWRVLHGRSVFTGSRILCGMYVSRSDYLSRAKNLGIIF